MGDWEILKMMDVDVVVVEEEHDHCNGGCMTPKHESCKIRVGPLPPPPPPRKKPYSAGKRPPKNGYFYPPQYDLDLIFHLPCKPITYVLDHHAR